MKTLRIFSVDVATDVEGENVRLKVNDFNNASPLWINTNREWQVQGHNFMLNKCDLSGFEVGVPV
jgi:hypothetical protein